MSEIIYLTDVAIITCIVDKERTEAVVLAARDVGARAAIVHSCLLYTSPSPRDGLLSRMPSSA